MSEALQYTIWGDPEPVESYAHKKRGRHDDRPVPCERENLWPSDLVKFLGVPLLEKLYGDIPRRSRLLVREVCRRLRCDSNLVYNRIKEGSLDGVNIGADDAAMAEWRVYRYSLVSWLFNREYRDDSTRAADHLTGEEQDRIFNAIQHRIQKRRGNG